MYIKNLNVTIAVICGLLVSLATILAGCSSRQTEETKNQDISPDDVAVSVREFFVEPEPEPESIRPQGRIKKPFEKLTNSLLNYDFEVYQVADSTSGPWFYGIECSKENDSFKNHDTGPLLPEELKSFIDFFAYVLVEASKVKPEDGPIEITLDKRIINNTALCGSITIPENARGYALIEIFDLDAVPGQALCFMQSLGEDSLGWEPHREKNITDMMKVLKRASSQE